MDVIAKPQHEAQMLQRYGIICFYMSYNPWYPLVHQQGKKIIVCKLLGTIEGLKIYSIHFEAKSWHNGGALQQWHCLMCIVGVVLTTCQFDKYRGLGVGQCRGSVDQLGPIWFSCMMIYRATIQSRHIGCLNVLIMSIKGRLMEKTIL